MLSCRDVHVTLFGVMKVKRTSYVTTREGCSPTNGATFKRAKGVEPHLKSIPGFGMIIVDFTNRVVLRDSQLPLVGVSKQWNNIANQAVTHSLSVK